MSDLRMFHIEIETEHASADYALIGALDYDIYDVDAGRGYTWDAWTEHRDRCLTSASSSTVRTALAEAFTAPPGNGYLTGRGDAPWLPDLDDQPGDQRTNTSAAPAEDPDRLRRRAALDMLLDTYRDDTTGALLDVACRAGIAVHYLDRSALEAELGRPFTEQEWQRVRPLLSGYD